MFIKKHFFNYKISKNSVQIGKFLLKGFDEAFSDGVLLVEKKDNFYNFYLPTLESNDTPFRGNVLCIFSHIEEYVYENGLLFIKEKINNNKFIFNVIEPNQFSWYLNEKNLQKRKESLPKIPCTKNSEITFLNFEFFHGIFIKIDEINYFIDNSSRLSIKRIKGNICPSKFLILLLFLTNLVMHSLKMENLTVIIMARLPHLNIVATHILIQIIIQATFIMIPEI